VPTYQYACTACDHRFEKVQTFTDPSLTECPECAGRLRKLYGSVGVVFKGSGFYRTDSRAKSSSSTAPAAPSTASESSAKTETTSPSSGSGEKSGTSSSTSSPTTPAAKAS
jgi:putative FmdB family regulatory protein